MIIQKIPSFDFAEVLWDEPDVDCHVLDPVFIFRFQAVPSEMQGMLLSHPSCCLYIKEAGEDNFDCMTFNRFSQNYLQFPTEDGKCPVLEFALNFEKEPKVVKIGFPLALLERNKIHEFVCLFNGIYLRIFCDGFLMDQEQPDGKIIHVYETKCKMRIHSAAIRNFMIGNDLQRIRKKVTERKIKKKIQFYTPFGYNTWVGDVVVSSWKNTFHLFYLMDRRHHGSRHGNGAHEFWHLTSENLVDWIDHGPLFELEAPWESIGTGNSFVWNEKLYLTYGLHTERAVPYQERANHLIYMNLHKLGHTGSFRFKELGTLLPGGASYYESEDGITFRKSNVLMHYLENPCVFVQKDNSLLLCQEGLWKSSHLGDWKLVDKTFPPCGEHSFAANCLDCPVMFELDGWEYCMVGFSAMWGRPIGTKNWIDFVEKGDSIYDGSNVPMVAPWTDGRLIEGGWGGGMKWGSVLLIREIFPLGNGRLGKRWIPETLPDWEVAHTLPANYSLPDSETLLLSFELTSNAELFRITFSGEGTACEFLLDCGRKRAQWAALQSGETSAKFLPTFREQILSHPEVHDYKELQYIPRNARDYAIENLPLPAKDPIELRVLVYRSKKVGNAILDLEIAGRRTMFSMRNDLKIEKIQFLHDSFVNKATIQLAKQQRENWN